MARERTIELEEEVARLGAVVAGPEVQAFFRTEVAPEAERLNGAVAELEVAARFLSGRYFAGEILREVRLAVVQGLSPWLSRSDAAAYARCSESEIDAAARRGVLTKYLRKGTPLFQKREIDAAIQEGKWAGKGKTRSAECGVKTSNQ